VIARKLSQTCIMVSEDVIAAQLPETQHIRIHFKLSPEEKKAYTQLKEEFALDLPEGKYETQWVLARSAKMHQLASGFVYRDDDEPLVYNKRKAEWVKTNLPEMLQRGPVIIWTSFLAHQAIIASEIGVPHSTVNGKLNQKEKRRQLDSFLQGKTDVLLIMEQIGFGALNLQRACNNIFCDCCYSAAMRENAEHRTHRIGTKKCVLYYDLVTRKTIDAAVLNAIQAKKDVAEAICKHVKGIEC